MIYSMTGFGSSEGDISNYHLKVEIKTVNSKFFDLNLRLPRELADKELDIKNYLTNQLKRGKANVVVELESKDSAVPTIHIDDQLFITYFNKYKELANETGADQKDLFRLALHSPDVVATNNLSEVLSWEDIQPILKEAIEQCMKSRKSEGGALAEKLTTYIRDIQDGLQLVEAEDGNRKSQIKNRLNQSLDEIRDRIQVDQNRFEQELIYYFEKLDITEEKVRLGRHLDYFMEVLEDEESQGKKLGFISQEIGREINTIGSKANDAVIQRAVVQMKDDLEKIKEQSLNIL